MISVSKRRRGNLCWYGNNIIKLNSPWKRPPIKSLSEKVQVSHRKERVVSYVWEGEKRRGGGDIVRQVRFCYMSASLARARGNTFLSESLGTVYFTEFHFIHLGFTKYKKNLLCWNCCWIDSLPLLILSLKSCGLNCGCNMCQISQKKVKTPYTAKHFFRETGQ